MSTSLLLFLYIGNALKRPVKSLGHPEIPFLKMEMQYHVLARQMWLSLIPS